MANHFHLPVSPVTLKTQTLRFPSLGGAGAGVGGVRTGVGGAQDGCGRGSGQVCCRCCGTGVAHCNQVCLHRRWVVVPRPRGADP